ncbi:unnamed protein product [Orchesella dallaii]|uniref:Uncharacterized protein n=1 Tax=Orchesella dallaii TaxID=48710 RepID=A0ABP1Q4G2_9HEXA
MTKEIMARLTESDLKIYDTLTREERQKFWLLYERDDNLENQFAAENLEWDNETDSAALAYLRKKVKKCGSSSSENDVSEAKVEEESSATVNKDRNALGESDDTEESSTESVEQFSEAETLEASEPYETRSRLRDCITEGQPRTHGIRVCNRE